MDFHIIYRTAVVHYGQYDYFDLQTWTMWAEPGVTAVAGFFAQVFFVERCWRIMDRMWSVLALFTLLLLLSLGSGLAVSISFFKVMLFSKLAKIPIPIYFWLISTAFTDATIAAILILGLRRSMSSTPCKRTGNVCSRLILLTMETSAITALVAILNLIFYAAMKETAWHLLPQFSICRVYTLAVLVTLLARDDLRAALDSQTSPSFALSGTRQDRNVNCVKVRVRTLLIRSQLPST
ncbi:hypothetical protein B0H10DRAFT_653326 [Mycena sp. CBHHK59/15]|nr:hypothetical protein B0H10DRAFT_653326 [Mycena sp. CBHHK59/15]